MIIEPRTRLARLPAPRHWIVAALAGAVAILALGLVLRIVPGVMSAEMALDEALTDHQVPVLTVVALALSTIFSPVGCVIILLAAFLFLLLVRRSPVNAFAFTGLAGFAWVCAEPVKLLVAEPRPSAAMLDHPLLAESGTDAFPSGHTTFVAALAIACWVLARGTRGQRAVGVAGVIAVIVMGAARLYVSAHTLGDVIGAVLVAATAAVLFSGVWNLIGVATMRRVRILRALGPIPTT